jgi:hypothetical protein
LTWAHVADLIEAFGAIALWRPAYRASLLKLARIPIVPKPGNTGAFGRFKKRFIARQEKRDVKWTEADHVWLIGGFVLLVASSAIKLFLDSAERTTNTVCGIEDFAKAMTRTVA